jgi:hypothetical protein
MFPWFPVVFSSLLWGGTLDISYEFLTQPSLSIYSSTLAWPDYTYIETGVSWQLTENLGVSVGHGFEDYEWNYVVVGARTDLYFGRLSLSGSLYAFYPLYDEWEAELSEFSVSTQRDQATPSYAGRQVHP